MKKMRPLFFLFVMLLIVLLSLLLVIGVSFLADPAINNGATTYTTEDLVCSWTPSGDTTNTTIMWYKDGVLFSNTTVSGSPTNNTVGSGNTTRDETWTCTITLENGTATTTKEANVTIENTAPLTPTILNGSTDIGSALNITEDGAFTLDMNSSDVDNDTLTYYFIDGKFCSVTDGATGAVSCQATHSYLDTNASGAENVTNVSIEFWVRDEPPNTKSSSKSIVFTITPVNDAPNTTIPAGQTTLVNETYNQTFTIIDEEGDFPANATLVTNLTSSNISDDILVSVENGNTLRVIYGPSPVEYGDVGNHTVTINLTDARNATTLINFTLEIRSVNREPYFTNITPQTHNSSQSYTYVLAQGETIFINLSANDPDTSSHDESLIFTDNSSMITTVTSNSTATTSSDAQGYINYTAQNGDVGTHLVALTVTDSAGASNTTVLNFTITNVNDPPVIYNQSYDSGNTAGNINITPLNAYLGAPFSYQLNYSDPDVALGLDILTWSDNSSSFNITSAGLISFTPNGLPRNETVNITVTDLAGASDTRSILLVISNNTQPYFNQTMPSLACSEGSLCFRNVSYYAKDDDAGDSIASYNATLNQSLSSFSINTTTGIISFTPAQSEIGNYALNLTITDTRGASAWQLINLSINNTEDTPRWLQYDFSGSIIVATHEFTYELIASDPDILLGSDNLTFTSNESWITLTYERTSNESVYALLSFTPNSSQVGSHSLQLNVSDQTGRINSTTVSFTVLADTDAPNFDAIRPYQNGSTMSRGWKSLTSSSSFTENITFSENTSSLIFEVNVSDDTTPSASLTYAWYYDGTLVQSGTGESAKSYTKSFGFFTNGTHTLVVTVNDTRLEQSRGTWNLNITNLNRAPTLLGNFSGTKNNLSISQTTLYNNYFVFENTTGGFYDPDDDTDEDGVIDATETLNLNYTASDCQYATLTMSDNNLQVAPVAVGTCYVTFTATDSAGENATSNLVTITVTEVPQGAESTVVSSGGGGGGSSSTSTLIPFETEVEKPHPLELIAPKVVEIYENETVKVPIELRNNWTSTLNRITLGASTNASGVSFSFDTNYIEELPVNGTKEVVLTVSGYRLGEDFEALITANVSDPVFSDSVEILFNSIQQSEEGKDVQVKVTFARDLLSQHEECQELGELLQQATEQLQQGNVRDAGAMIDTVINGCQYLISRTNVVQQPGFVRTPWLPFSDRTLSIVVFTFFGVFILIALLSVLYFHHKREEYDF